MPNSYRLSKSLIVKYDYQIMQNSHRNIEQAIVYAKTKRN